MRRLPRVMRSVSPLQQGVENEYPYYARQIMIKGMLPWLKRHFRTVLLVSIGLGLVPAYLQAFRINGPSEAPTVLLGDTVIVNKAAYSVRLPYSNEKLLRTGSPLRGDMVQMRFPNRGFIGIKRVMGVPGETVELRENRVIVNGQAIAVKTLNRADFAWVPQVHGIGSSVESEDGHWITYTPGKSEYRNHPPTRLAEGQYFVLGDNRDDSYDSREFGPLADNMILGKVIAILPTGPRQ